MSFKRSCTSAAFRLCESRRVVPAIFIPRNLVLSLKTQRRHVSNNSHCKVSQERLMADIHGTSDMGIGERWGPGKTETGMSRLSLSNDDKDARKWFEATANKLGCECSVDEMGNQFAIKAGKKGGPPTFAGSHLDTQPKGGRYDGVLGVCAALEMLRVLDENGKQTEYDVGVVNWTNEEGARFPISMVGSGVWAGDIPLERAHNLASVVQGDSSTLLSELERIRFKGDTKCSYKAMPMAAHFELHIEQGPILEASGQKIGIVEGVQAYRWMTIEVFGRDAHTGSTSLDTRSDALLAASAMILSTREIAHTHGGLASVGIIDAKPGSTNTIPGYVRFSLDVRAKSNTVRDNICDALKQRFQGLANPAPLDKKGSTVPMDVVEVKWREDFVSDATIFSQDCIGCVEVACEEVFGDAAATLTRKMVSGAGHDSVYASQRCPTSMIFVPSKDGISHNPREYTSPEDCALGAQVLLNAVLNFDRTRAS